MKKKYLLMTVVLVLNFATITVAQVPNYVPTNGLVGWWGFNGNANDESGNGNNGTVNGATLTTDRFGNTNSAYDFDGNDNIDIGNMFDFQERTTNLWLTCTDPNWGGITRLAFDNDNSNMSYGLVQFGTGVGQPDSIGMGQGNQSTRNFGVLVTWYMCSIIRDSDSVRFYFNGVLTSTKAVGTAASVINNIPTRIGGRVDNTRYWLGKIDDLGIWNRALTQQEITNLYNGCQLLVNAQPTSQTFSINTNAQFTVNSSDTSATFQWQTDLGVGYQNLNSVGQYSGTATNTLIVSNVTMSNNNQPFRCIISSGSCSDTSNVAVLTVNNNVGINEYAQDHLFSVFPNPAQSVINIKSDTKLIGEIYSIYDNTGKVVLTGILKSENTTIDLGNLSGGIYLFSVGENMKQSFKVIKE